MLNQCSVPLTGARTAYRRAQTIVPTSSEQLAKTTQTSYDPLQYLKRKYRHPAPRRKHHTNKTRLALKRTGGLTIESYSEHELARKTYTTCCWSVANNPMCQHNAIGRCTISSTARPLEVYYHTTVQGSLCENRPKLSRQK